MNTFHETARQGFLDIIDDGRPRVVVVGGGFGGLACVQALAAQPVQVVLVDRRNFHTFQPLLYQVATGGLQPESVAYPIRRALRGQRNAQFVVASLTHIDPDKQEIETSAGRVRYDYLVLALGATTRLPQLEVKQDELHPLKTLDDAVDFRTGILRNLERAMAVSDRDLMDYLTNFVVVGGGPTGVELAGAIAELKRFVVPNDYPRLDPELMSIYLIHPQEDLLNGMSKESAHRALRYLQEMGVEVQLKSRVAQYDGKIVTLTDGRTIPSAFVAWAAGVVALPVQGLDRADREFFPRLKVDEVNRVCGYENIFALGDLAAMVTPTLPTGHPMLAPIAMQQGRQLAANLGALLAEQPLKPFRYRDKGWMATVGRNRAVADIFGLHFGGFLAWFLWGVVHLAFLIGFRSKLLVLVDWIWSYLTYDRSTRLILKEEDPC